MTLKESLQMQREQPEGTFCIIKTGIFYRGYNEGAYGLAHLMGYKVIENAPKEGEKYMCVGFPAERLPQVKAKVAEKGGTVSDLSDEVVVISGVDTTPVAAEPREMSARKTASKICDVDEAALNTVVAQIRAFDVEHSTPIFALSFVENLKRILNV